MADMEMIERRIEKAKKASKGDKKFAQEAEVFTALLAHLNEGNTVRSYDCSPEEKELIAGSELISAKPVIYAANLDDVNFPTYATNPYYTALKAMADAEGALVLPICAKIEQEIAELPAEDKQLFLEELGIAESGLDRLIRCSYSLLGLISYLTAGPEEVRAWTITKGTKAPQAAGKIHTDFERGFIRAEVVAYQDLYSCGNMVAAKEKGLVRSEGKEYVMQDGDVVLFRFNV